MGDTRLSRLVVSAEHVREIDSCLDRLVEDSNSNYALLLDRSGQLVTWRGDRPGSELDTLGALVAGNFASAREIARLIGEEGFGAVLQQGQRQHVFTALVCEHWMLCIVFDVRTPVGLVKMLCGRAATELEKVHTVVCAANAGPSDGLALDQGFRVLAQRTIDLLLQDGG